MQIVADLHKQLRKHPAPYRTDVAGCIQSLDALRDAVREIGERAARLASKHPQILYHRFIADLVGELIAKAVDVGQHLVLRFVDRPELEVEPDQRVMPQCIGVFVEIGIVPPNEFPQQKFDSEVTRHPTLRNPSTVRRHPDWGDSPGRRNADELLASAKTTITGLQAEGGDRSEVGQLLRQAGLSAGSRS